MADIKYLSASLKPQELYYFLFPTDQPELIFPSTLSPTDKGSSYSSMEILTGFFHRARTGTHQGAEDKRDLYVCSK